MPRRALVMTVLALGAGSLLGGCGPDTATVRGEVTLDGQPLDHGVISYVPADGLGAPATATVEKGRYEVRTAPGHKRVQISAPVVTGKRKAYEGPDAPLVETTAERLPARYNSSTELVFEVKPGANTGDWSVQSQARKP